LGLGFHPFAKLGVSKIFDMDSYLNPSLTQMVDHMYTSGARISSNSWGSYNNNYTANNQSYDSLVLDSQRTVDGNQELTVVFSSGNGGLVSKLTSPGNAKNTIMVGASENLRPGD